MDTLAPLARMAADAWQSALALATGGLGDGLSPVWLIGAGVTVASLMVVFLLVESGAQKSRRDRVNAVVRRSARPATAAGKDMVTPTKTKTKPARSVGKSMLPRAALLRDRIDRAGLSLSVGAYAGLSAGLGVLGLVAGLFAPGSNPLIAMLAAVVLGIGLPHLTLTVLASQRRATFLNNFPEAIDLMVRGIRSGLPVTEGMKSVAQEEPDPVGGEFRRVVDGLAIGRTLTDSLQDAARRIGAPEFDFFVVTLSVQKETGGNLAETLDNLADILRKRRQAKLKIKALSAEARMSALIIGALPFVMFVIISIIQPSYTGQLLSDPRGHVMIAAGLLWLAVGGVVMSRMVNIKQ